MDICSKIYINIFVGMTKMYVFSSLLSPFTFPNVPPHLSPLQHISQKHKYIQIVQTSFESKSFKPQSSLDGSMATHQAAHMVKITIQTEGATLKLTRKHVHTATNISMGVALERPPHT